MKNLIENKGFKKDMKLVEKRQHRVSKLWSIVESLLLDKELPHNARPHKLKGEYNGFWECHIEPDWLLIYTFDEDDLYLHRTGRHQDLFDKY